MGEEELPKFEWTPQRAWTDSIIYNTLITTFESGKEQRRAKGPPKRVFKLQFSKKSTIEGEGLGEEEEYTNEAHEIYEFFCEREGPLKPFEWDYLASDGEVETVTVRFGEDEFTRDTFLGLIYSFPLTFIEVI